MFYHILLFTSMFRTHQGVEQDQSNIQTIAQNV